MNSKTEPAQPGRAFAKKAFSPSVKKIQEMLGTRDRNQLMEELGDARNKLDDALKQFIRHRTSFYLGTSSVDGEPYIQHRGGEAGFIEIVDDETLRIPDYPGNKQYITLGNLSENPRAFLFMMDYENKARVKFWGRAKVDDLAGNNRALLYHIEAWDLNCPKHIPDLFSVATVQVTTRKLAERVSELEAELEQQRKLARSADD